MIIIGILGSGAFAGIIGIIQVGQTERDAKEDAIVVATSRAAEATSLVAEATSSARDEKMLDLQIELATRQHELQNQENFGDATKTAENIMELQSTIEFLNTQQVTLEPDTTPTSIATLVGNSVLNPDIFIREYFTALSNQNYERSWQMLSTEFKDKHHCCNTDGSYQLQPYINWWNNFEYIEVMRVSIEDQTSDTATILVTSEYMPLDGEPYESRNNFYLIREDSAWLIDDYD